MRLALQRDCSLTIRSPATGICYEFRPNIREVDVREQADIAYILAVHGASIQPANPVARGWALYQGEEPEVCVELLTGEVTLQRGKPACVSLAQEIELVQRERWPRVPPTLTYKCGMRRLLVTRDQGLGDMLMLSAALRALKRECPKLDITLSTHKAWFGILREQEGIDRCIEMHDDMPGAPYDQHVNLVQYVELAESRFDKHRVDIFGEPLGLDGVEDRTVNVRLGKDELATARETLNGVGRPVIGVVYRGSTNARSYPKDQIPVLCEVLGRDATVAFIDHQPQPGVSLPEGSVDLCGTCDPLELAAMIANMDCVVAPDTGIVHLAAAVGTPVVALTGSIPGDLRWSAYDDITVIDGAKQVGCTHCYDGPNCRPGDVGSESLTDWAPPCMRAMSPEQVAKAVAQVVN